MGTLQIERKEAPKLTREQRIEVKKEKIRTRLEAKGMEYSQIETYLESLFNTVKKPN